jgi:Zn-dependent peptidase ImmA (M78 family)
MKRVRNAANEIRDYYGYEIVSFKELEALTRTKGAHIEYKPITGAQGRISFSQSSKTAYIAIDSNINYQPKKKFVLAHELGHFVLHKNYPGFVCEDEDFQDWNSKKRVETEANEFAAELLMPSNLFSMKVPDQGISLDDLSEIALEFGTSLTATLMRYVELGPIPAMVIYSKDGRIMWWKKSSSFFGYFHKSQELPKQMNAAKFYRDGATNITPNHLLGHQIIQGEGIKRDYYLTEETVYMTNLNSALSFLYQSKKFNL